MTVDGVVDGDDICRSREPLMFHTANENGKKIWKLIFIFFCVIILTVIKFV